MGNEKAEIETSQDILLIVKIKYQQKLSLLKEWKQSKEKIVSLRIYVFSGEEIK